MLNSTQINKYEVLITTNHLKQNPYEMDLGKGQVENLTWLLR